MRLKNIKKFRFIATFLLIGTFSISANAHCDTMDGPTVIDGQKSMKENNINYALKWVQPNFEKELKEAFNLSMKVKDLSPESKQIAEKYFFGELVRIHRQGEDAPYTGVKPAGTTIDKKVLAADKSIEIGNLSNLENLIEKDKKAELKKRFDQVIALKNFDINNVDAGREYIEAYVKFFKFAEGEEHHAHTKEVHDKKAHH